MFLHLNSLYYMAKSMWTAEHFLCIKTTSLKLIKCAQTSAALPDLFLKLSIMSQSELQAFNDKSVEDSLAPI